MSRMGKFEVDPNEPCPKCGKVIQVGDYPICRGDQKDHGEWMTPDHPCEEFVDEMCDTEPRRFSSTREWVRYLDKNNIVPRENKTDNRIRGESRLFFDLSKR